MMNPVQEAMAGSRALPTGREKPHLLDDRQPCSADSCEFSALIALGQKLLCLKHFIVRCYEWLDYLEPQIQGRLFVRAGMRRAQAMVEECSNRALLVSLRCEDLTNLDRSRLLHILLLSSDLLFQLRVPRNEFLFRCRAKSAVSKSQSPALAAKSASHAS
ncbi:MAG TPA: hypothetical protein VKH45_04910 [Candidatus Acidoferrum sp.]|nr:hypothetical protein [Candidatus Acidoferrum sp.]